MNPCHIYPFFPCILLMVLMVSARDIPPSCQIIILSMPVNGLRLGSEVPQFLLFTRGIVDLKGRSKLNRVPIDLLSPRSTERRSTPVPGNVTLSPITPPKEEVNKRLRLVIEHEDPDDDDDDDDRRPLEEE